GDDAPWVVIKPEGNCRPVASEYIAHAAEMVASVEVVARPFPEALIEVVSLDRRAASPLTDPRTAPNERLILGLDAVLDLLDTHAMRFAVVLVHALMRALEEPHEAVLLIPPVLADDGAVRLLLEAQVAVAVVLELLRL